MAKFVIFAAMMLAFLALAHEASSFRTTITTVVEEDDSLAMNQGGQIQQRCRQQIQRQSQQIRNCQQYIQSGQRGSPFELNMVVNQQGQGQQQQEQQQLRQCCQTLQNIEEQCQCEAIREAVRQVRQQGGQGQQQQQETQQAIQKARNIPQQCNLRQQECQIY